MTLHNIAVAAKDGTGTTIPGGIRQHDSSGTGVGPNVPELIAVDSAGAEILGTTADAAAANTDTTPLSGMSVWKQISKSIQAAAASLAGTLTVATHAVTQSGSWVLSAGAAIIGKVGIDQTIPGTTNGVVVNSGSITANAGTNLNTSALALESGGNLAATAAGIGATSGAAVVTDANGTIQQYLRGLVKLIAAGINVVITNANANGGTTPANSAPVVAADQYSTHKEIAAGVTAGVLGATGAAGDYLDSVTVYPGVVGCGVVTILDGSTAIGTFAGGGTTVLPSCIPFTISVGAFCTGAGWHITTGANVTVSCKGKFT